MALSDGLMKSLGQQLGELASKHKVPGAVLAILDGRDVGECATGLLNLNTGVATTTDSLFQIGSITKIYTATLVMQLIDQGAIDLDHPVEEYLPDSRLGSSETQTPITVRHLLSHTSGIDGDYFEDFGRGDGAIRRYAAACAQLPQLFSPGEMFSYCNAGFVVLGRIIEVLTREPFRIALRSRLVEPLGVEGPLTLPEEAILHRVAAGHVKDPQHHVPKVTSVWSLPHATAPAGGTTCGTARDLLALARLHLDEGRFDDSKYVLSPGSVAAMQERQIELPSTRPGEEAWGLGWALDVWGGEPIFGHDGGTIGQRAFLRVAPDKELAVALVSNSYTSGPLYEQLFRQVFEELRGIRMPQRPQPPADEPPELDLGSYTGGYERRGVRNVVSKREEQLVLDQTLAGELAELEGEGQGERALLPANESTFFVYDKDVEEHHPLFFLNFTSGKPQYLFDGRVARRTA